MNGEQPESTEPPNAAGPSLPPVGSYLRAVIALGWTSFPSSWPLLTVIAFFEMWMESYFKLVKNEGPLSVSWLIPASSSSIGP